MRLLIAVAELAAISLILTNQVLAANVQSLTISPTSNQIAVDAGSKTSGVVKVINGGNEPLTVDVSVTPYSVQGEQYDPRFQTAPGFNGASDWFHFDKQLFTLKPHQYQEVPYTVTVPARVGPGGYYAVVFAETQPDKLQGSGVQTLSRVGSIFYVRVNGSVSEAGNVVSWQAPFLQTNRPVTTKLRISNTGNVHFVANSTVVIKNVIGSHKTTVNDTHVILPGTTRALTISGTKGTSFGLFKVTGTTSFLHGSQTLPSHYVLAMPEAVIVFFAAAILLVFTTLAYYLIQKRKK